MLFLVLAMVTKGLSPFCSAFKRGVQCVSGTAPQDLVFDGLTVLVLGQGQAGSPFLCFSFSPVLLLSHFTKKFKAMDRLMHRSGERGRKE